MGFGLQSKIEISSRPKPTSTGASPRCAMQDAQAGSRSSCSPVPDPGNNEEEKKERSKGVARGGILWPRAGCAASAITRHAKPFLELLCHAKQGGACNSRLDSYPCTGCKPNGMMKRLWMCHQEFRSLIGRNQLTSKASPRGAMQDSLVGCGSC